jgi:hypothetical protein
MVIYGTCLVAGETRKGDIFSKEELSRHGCTLIHGPIESYAHSWDDGKNHWLSFPENVVLDAEEVNGELQYIASVEDKAIQEAIRSGEITGVSVNALCRRVPAGQPGMCQGMILNGFCLLGKDSVPASPGTNVRVWNSIPVPLRLEAGETEKVGEKTSEKKTEQVTGYGPAAGVAEPSIEDRVKTLEQSFEGFRQYVSEQFTSINASLGTLIAVTNSLKPAVPATPVQKTEEAQATAGPVAATVPIAKLPPAVIAVTAEEIDAIAQDRRYFTPMLKLNAILDLVDRKRSEAA